MTTLTAFSGDRRIAAGPPAETAAAVRAALARGMSVTLLDDATGRVVDLHPDGRPALPDTPAEPRGRGRPRLGVTSREVTLLPRHWDWLARQKGGTSAALRRLVDAARREVEGRPDPGAARERAYRAMTVLAGDRPGYEEATRALFAGDRAAFAARAAAWPADIGAYVAELAEDGLA